MKPSQRVFLCFLVGIASVAAISWPVCDRTDMAWTTDTPRLTGQYPFASLLCAPSIPLHEPPGLMQRAILHLEFLIVRTIYFSC